jgi:hypothetical protein
MRDQGGRFNARLPAAMIAATSSTMGEYMRSAHQNKGSNPLIYILTTHQTRKRSLISSSDTCAVYNLSQF